jgi:hypothetical protein
MIILDNALPLSVFRNIKDQVFDASFPWYFTKTTEKNITESINTTSFAHVCFMNTGVMTLNGSILTTNISDDCKKSLFIISRKLNFEIKSIIRSRFGLLQPKPQGKYINFPHIDFIKNNFTGLLYFNNSDGETIVYNEKYDINSNMNSMEYYENILKKNVTIKQKIECKENRFIMFDGFHYHSSVSPTNVSRRIVLNFNFEIE